MDAIHLLTTAVQLGRGLSGTTPTLPLEIRGPSTQGEELSLASTYNLIFVLLNAWGGVIGKQ